MKNDFIEPTIHLGNKLATWIGATLTNVIKVAHPCLLKDLKVLEETKLFVFTEQDDFSLKLSLLEASKKCSKLSKKKIEIFIETLHGLKNTAKNNKLVSIKELDYYMISGQHRVHKVLLEELFFDSKNGDSYRSKKTSSSTQ